MRLPERQTAIGAAILLLSTAAQAKHSHLEALERRHHHLHKKAHASPRVEDSAGLNKRGQCEFPTGVGLVPVTPGSQNGGWAMSPNQPCLPGNYCPYACPPGQLMAQWDPLATSYIYPLSMHGGLFCDSNGQISKPFPNKPYCYPGTGSVGAQNNCGGMVAFCQTVLPGNEAMLIPTPVEPSAVLAVPGPDYWASTATHYYVNPPGYSTDQACIWGDGSLPIGNWSPYVAGANADGSGLTFVKVAWNPIYTGPSNFQNVLPTWGIEIICEGGGCNGLPCKIDPSVNGINQVTSADQATGAGGANFCVVTVPAGGKAQIVVFNAGDSNSGASSDAIPANLPSSSASVAPTSSKGTSTSAPPSSSSSTSTSSKTSSSTTSSSSSVHATIHHTKPTTTKPYPSYTDAPHVLFENATSTSNSSTAATASSAGSLSTSSSSSPASTSVITKGAASSTLVSTGTIGLAGLLAVAFNYIL